MTDLWTYLRNTDKAIALYGGGNGADKILDKLIADGSASKVASVFASDGFVRSGKFRGFTVESYSSAKERLGDMIVLVCFGSARADVLRNIERIASENELYIPDVPVYGDNIFDMDFYKEHEAEILTVKNRLADELSVRTCEKMTEYKLTGSLKALRSCETEADEADGLFDLPDKSVFVDLGAYTGDTVRRYLELFPQIDEIYAVEPDSRNYRKLCENCKEFQAGRKMELIRAMTGDRVGEVMMPRNRGRGVSIDARAASVSGNMGNMDIVPEITIDSLLKGGKADFIKFDIEGSEAKAIEGARETIIRYKPQMLISCYHRSEDIFDLPLRIFDIRDDYRLYMRHLPCVPGWDTAFYLI